MCVRLIGCWLLLVLRLEMPGGGRRVAYSGQGGRMLNVCFRPKADIPMERLDARHGLSVEIRTGKRRVIDYLLRPLQKHMGEGMRGR